MKKIIITTFCISLLIFACKKETKNIQNSGNEKTFGPQESSQSIPSFSDGSQAEIQLRHLAHGFASLVENYDINRYGEEAYMFDLNYNIPSGSHEMGLLTFHDILFANPSGSPTKFRTIGNGLGNTDDHYEAIKHSITNHVPPVSISPAWNPDFYSGCIIGSTRYKTIIRIPEFQTTQYYYNIDNKTPILFIGKNLTQPDNYIGYYWNKTTKKINQITIANDDVLDDLLERKVYYVVVIDIDPIDDKYNGKGEKIFSDCGEVNCGDGYCDKRCEKDGKVEDDNCVDCNNKQTNGLLKLVEIKIDNDERTTKGGTTTVEDNYFVDNLGGKYKLKLNAIIIHKNNQWEALRNVKIRPKWEQKEVKRIRHANGWLRQTKSRGNETWKKVWALGDDEAEKNQSGIVLSEHFNRLGSHLYISISEEDNFMGVKRDFTGPISPYGSSFTVPLTNFWKSQRMPTLTGPAKTIWDKDDSKNGLPLSALSCSSHVIPSYWKDPITGLIKDAIEIKSHNVTYKLVIE